MSDHPVVGVFHGEGAQVASAVFRTQAEGLVWAAKHSAPGILTEYPVGDGCYGIAVAQGSLTSTRPRHGSPEHVAGFSPGWTQHTHITAGTPE
ncbi:DUF7710 domain-containing protein [Cellulomonas sp. P4]|uniref:DUF7710 domain-containing protein n=1 Tax=Cellulomonas sp. P4 TaxID=3142533 RepID=UPI0031BA4AE3